jgi:hypothetical protein
MKAAGCTAVGGGAAYVCWLNESVATVAEGGTTGTAEVVGGTRVAGDRTGVIGETGGR